VTPSPTHPIRQEISALTRLAIPLAIAQGGQALMGVVDAAVVGRLGAIPLAGVGLGNALQLGVSILGIGVMMGLDPLFAQAIGAGDRLRARRLLWQGIWMSVAVAAVLSLPLLLAPLALEPLGIEHAVAAEAGPYVLWRTPALVFLFVYGVSRGYLQASNVTRPIVVATVVANVVNLPLDVLLVFGGAGLPAWTGPLRLVPAMSAAGAAIATSVCTLLQAALLLVAVSRTGLPADKESVRPEPVEGRRPNASELRVAFRVGLPIGLHLAAEVGIFALVGFLAGRLGAVPLAAHQVAIAIASLTFTVAVGFGNGGSVRVGWAVGARDRVAARRSGLVAFGAGAAFMTGCGLVFMAFPGAIARLLTDDPAVLATATPLLRVAALFQISDGIQGVGAGVLRGAGETRFTFAANVLGHWALGFPAAVLLGLVFDGGVVGLWWGFWIGLTTVAVALLWRFLRVSEREIVPLPASSPPSPLVGREAGGGDGQPRRKTPIAR
jgi:MATE family multidrug resistance protein